MKKTNLSYRIALITAGVMACQSTLAPRPSHALVAALTGGTAIPALIVIGAGTVAVPGAWWWAVSPSGTGIYSWAEAELVAVGAILVGLVLLDESGAPTPDLTRISPAEAQGGGISPSGMHAFNRELDRINSVSESIARGIADHRITQARDAVAFARSEWSTAHEQGLISDAAYSALTKRGDTTAARAQRLGRGGR